MNDTDIIFIVGMHRSGTSLVGELLETAGYHFGENLIGKAADNPRGFWEDRELISINNLLLGGTEEWASISPKKCKKSSDTLTTIYAEQWLNKLASTLPSNKLAFKDPRLCRNLDFWLDFLPKNSKAIFVWRHPVAVAKSLEKRNNIPLSKGVLLWALYNYEALRSLTRNNTTYTVIEYDTLIHSPTEVGQSIADFIGSGEINTLCVDEKLNHNHHAAQGDIVLPQEIQDFSQKVLEFIINGNVDELHTIEPLYEHIIKNFQFLDKRPKPPVCVAEKLPTKHRLSIIGHRIVYNRKWGIFTTPMHFGYRTAARLYRMAMAMAHSPKRILELTATLPTHDLIQNRANAVVPPPILADNMAADALLPDITISIVTYNNGIWLTPFLRSLQAQTYPLEKIHIHFIDNSSTDTTPDALKKAQAQFQDLFASFTLTFQDNVGFGAGHDVAMRAAKTDYVLVSNIDLIFEKYSIRNVVCTALSSTNTASWELRQKPYEHPKYVDPITLDVSWSSHACILLCREKYIEVGGYEPRIFMYGEDVELSYRFRRAGYRLKYVPTASVYHYTYSDVNETKPLQFEGSIQANHYIRMRYGNIKHVCTSFLQIALLCRKKYRTSALKEHARNAQRNALKNSLYFLLSRKRSNASFPFHGFDYDLTRKGAFFPQLFLNIEDYTDSLPLVTIVTRTVKGRAGLLEQCLFSVMNQTYPKIEHLIVEDGGSSAVDIVEKFLPATSDTYTIKHIAAPKNGRSFAGNLGMSHASGEYIVLLDDDDLIFPDHIETLISGIIAGNTDAAYSLAWDVKTNMKDKNAAIYQEMAYISHPLFAQQVTYDLLSVCNCFPIQSVIFSKTLFEQYGGFEENRETYEDWLLWRKYALYTRFHYIEKTTSLYRTPASKAEEEKRADIFRKEYIKLKESAHP